MKDFPGPPGEGSVPGPGVVSYTTVQDGRRDGKSPTKVIPLLAEGKVRPLALCCCGGCSDERPLLPLVFEDSVSCHCVVYAYNLRCFKWSCYFALLFLTLFLLLFRVKYLFQCKLY